VDSRPELPAADLGLSLVTTRSTFEHRAVVVGRDRGELLANLATLTESGAAGAPGKVVFVFPGQGSQWTGMAVRLLDSSPVFAARMAECAAALAPFTDWSLLEVLRDGAELDRVDVIQPALFAILVSLAEVWRSLGVRPDAVVGHSQGEIAAACVAGALSLSDAARVVALRSRALPELSGKGGMVSASLPAAEVTARLAAGGRDLAVAAVNGPSSVVVSGAADAVTEFLAECQADGIRARRIPVDYASHSAHVEQLEEQLLAALAPIVPRTSEVPFYSTVTGGLIDTAELDAGYWYRNLRQTVEFERTTEVLVTDGHGVFVECSPHPVLTMAIEDTADVVTVGTLRRDDGGMDRVLTSAGEAYVRGVRVDWAGVFAGSGARRVDLPAYAFQHKRFWLDFQSAPMAESALEDVEFWDAVEREDLESLSGTLSVDGDSLATVLPALSRWRRQQRDESVVDGWRYHVSWEPVAEPAVPESLGRWLVVAPAGQAGHDWVRACVDALPGNSVLHLASGVDRIDLAGRLRGEQFDGVLSLLGLDEEEAQPGVTSGLVSTLVLMQALGDAEMAAPLWCVTTGAVSTSTEDRLASPIQSQIWGLGRVVGLEQPRRWGGLVDLPEAPDALAVGRLLGTVAGTSEDQVAIRAGGAFGRRLVRAPSRRVSGPHKEWKPRGTVLVTGATGALGPVIARWLAGNGAEHLVLTSRRGGAANGMAELEAELAEMGTQVTMAACDVADGEALSALVGKVEADGSVIRAVVHAAALIRLVPLAETTVDEFAEVVAAKVAGAAHLDVLFAGRELDAFVLFSSIAGVWGSGDHGAYAAAAAFLDALAEQRRARGEVATSVAWGVWDAVHVLDNGDVVEDLMELNPEWHGLSPMDPDLGMRSLQYALDLDETFVAVADVDWDRFTAAFTSSRPSPLIGGLPEVRRILDAEAVTDETVAGTREAWRDRLLVLSNAERQRVVLDLVRAHASSVLGHASTDEVDPAQAFQEQGFDSLTAVDLRNRLTSATGLRLPATLVFDHPNASALASHVLDELFPDSLTEPGLDELDKLEAALAARAVDDATRTEITLRLKSLLSQWIDGGEPAGGSQRRDLGSATDDELFGVLDELRTS
jgi:acyl transferase domain-containing protein/acyl carrier protein